jgi:(2R)-ethylmalonyl-CoA mutase
MSQAQKDRPWLIRTYAGHSTAQASNALYRANLAKGQTGLSVAFDLPTQTGYDSDHTLARGEVGKVGVPVCHLGDMRTLFNDIPLDQMNTSMTINATAPWMLALYIAVAEEQGADVKTLQGTVQNDLIKEYLSRGTYICPPKPSLKLIGDVAEYCYKNVPKWNPMNVCSYHLQEAGATPEQELSYALATAIAVLDELKPRVAPEDFPALCGRISFFVNAGIRFVTEMCKMRAFVDLWDEILTERYRRHRPPSSAFPVWGSGKFTWPDRTATRKQCVPYSDRNVGRDPIEKGTRACCAVACMERGIGPSPSMGSAMVHAHAADHGI